MEAQTRVETSSPVVLLSKRTATRPIIPFRPIRKYFWRMLIRYSMNTEADSNSAVELLVPLRFFSSQVLGPRTYCPALASILKLTCPLDITFRITFRTLCIGPLRKFHVILLSAVLCTVLAAIGPVIQGEAAQIYLEGRC